MQRSLVGSEMCISDRVMRGTGESQVRALSRVPDILNIPACRLATSVLVRRSRTGTGPEIPYLPLL
jgi:hypothetical protein